MKNIVIRQWSAIWSLSGLLLFVLVMPVYTAANSIHVGRYESSAWGFNTNSWWVEGPTGIVLINTQFLPSATKSAVEIAEQYTGKKVVLAFVLHANPDKFNGSQYLKSRGVRVVSSEQVIKVIPGVDALRRRWFYDRYKPDYPAKLVLPESIGSKNISIAAAGLKFDVHILSASVSKAHIAIKVGKHLFVGDILANRHHSWLELGLVDHWVMTLHKLKKLKPKYLYPGRGYASGVNLIDEQIIYLQSVQKIISQVKQNDSFNDKSKQRVIQKIKRLYPDYGNSYFLTLGVEPVWNSITGK